VCDPSLTRAILERFRDSFLMIKRYRNLHLFLLYFHKVVSMFQGVMKNFSVSFMPNFLRILYTKKNYSKTQHTLIRKENVNGGNYQARVNCTLSVLSHYNRTSAKQRE